MVGKMDFQVVPFFWIEWWIGGVYQLGVWALGGGVVVWWLPVGCLGQQKNMMLIWVVGTEGLRLYEIFSFFLFCDDSGCVVLLY
jgi:hypothetical protein